MKEYAVVIFVVISAILFIPLIYVMEQADDRARARAEEKDRRREAAVSKFSKENISKCKADPSQFECQLYANGRWGCKDEVCSFN